MIDDEEHQANLQSGNFIPKGVRTLEGVFDLNNKLRKSTNVKTNSSSMQYELVNLGTEVEPKYVTWENIVHQGEEANLLVYFDDINMFLLGHMKT